MGMTINTNPLAADLDHILEHTRDLWEELRGERLFITGGTGFFGCWLLESFIWAVERLGLNSRAFVLTRLPNAFRQKIPHLAGHEAVTLIKGNVRSFKFPKGGFSHVVHAAAEYGTKVNAEDALLLLDTIVEGTRHTLDFTRSCHAKKFLLISSGAVYGKQPSEMTHIPEDYIGAPNPLDPGSAYGEGKRLAEHMCALYARQTSIEMKIARCFAFVGPYLLLDSHFVIGNFIRDSMRGGPIVIKGDGTSHRSYLYAADLAIWLWKILFCGRELQPYNVGSEFSISIRSLAKIIAGFSKPESEILIKEPVQTVITSGHYVPSTKIARDELGLKAWIDLQTAINKTNLWYSETSQ